MATGASSFVETEVVFPVSCDRDHHLSCSEEGIRLMRELTRRQSKQSIKEGRDSQLLLPVADLKVQWKKKGKEELHSFCQNTKRDRRESYFERSVGIKQRPVEMSGRTTYWTLPPKRAPFQNGVDR
jgi:hypothetical protein